ncbi:class III signal peptide-containing protein [Methanobacterium paludis]|uniref:Class III signal peptide-containing protein n=1 Tax=Methanobacterium paludis (strain DSM 25820 / JCM 18151 / SWAN1) TaxID=868131 RepID=F6D801_METPW|nr:class III signal peptide-containing protein [Methanobacterium paludis]AEG18524.1 hypothetical protein MSWAN_1510 [Methanobacterium paludis]
MGFIEDEWGQGAAEYILLFGGVIVIAIAALFVYDSYFSGANTLNAAQDMDKVRSSIKV